ncbi:beta-lactamase/transpeptidase-like protein [Lindgomyces ingoldianus]|uniref:Beta-lactamase/transpeptidase-like protein n=1 Tax=Lindgomyces ingoldianus TaxID=673940 RepID=A0ACB6R6Z6_9PLEO|nr:beta-lactamase/transpeptidase-like protein [Lindgomyces ingoldianus]KAF2474095.1 beta-lactamase/transpeptidase-like protein [Lindgomyces ingoldianus]
MEDLEQVIKKACEDLDIPGCVLQAVNRDGSFKYAKTFGKRSIQPGGDQSPLQLNSVMWIASCTKLMTSICAMQLVERGLLSLDGPIYDIIPELRDQPVLTGFDDTGKPIEVPHKNPISLKLLLTHSSGLTYDSMHPLAAGWLKYHNLVPATDSKLLTRFGRLPLVFEPGTSWAYGPGIDYAGLLVERVSKMSLQDYMKKHLWEPLGVRNMTFFLASRPDLKAHMADMNKRDPESGKIVYTNERQPYQDGEKNEVEDCMGGQGVFSSAEEYIKILQGVLATDENEKILKKETVELLFTPYLSKGGSDTLNAFMQNAEANNAMGGISQEVRKDYALGGLFLCGDAPGGKGMKEGTLMWGGVPNLIWFCDRKTGLAGLYAGQVVPPGDAKCAGFTRMFEDAMYERYKS